MATATLEIDDELLYEIVDGEVVEKEVVASQVWISSLLACQIQHHGSGRAVPEMLFAFGSELPNRRPDVAFVSYNRWPRRRRVPASNAWPVVPELAVEVVSPTNSFDEIVGKVREYFSAGVEQAWVVMPSEQQVYVYQSPTNISVLTLEDTLTGGELLPDFRLPLTELFDIEADED